jgi:hypothetical protein
MACVQMWCIDGRGAGCAPPTLMRGNVSIPQPRTRRVHWTIHPQQGQTKSSCHGVCECPLVCHQAQRLARDFEHLARALGQLIQKQNPMVSEGDLPAHGNLGPADEPRIEDGMMGSPKRAGGHKGHAKAGDAMDARRFDGSGRLRSGRKGARRRANIDVPTPVEEWSAPLPQAWRHHGHSRGVWRSSRAGCTEGYRPQGTPP